MSAINAQTFPKSDMIPGVNIVGDKAIEVSANEAGWGGGVWRTLCTPLAGLTVHQVIANNQLGNS